MSIPTYHRPRLAFPSRYGTPTRLGLAPQSTIATPAQHQVSPKLEGITKTGGFRSVTELLLHTINDPIASSKGCSHIVDVDAFLADPDATAGTRFSSYDSIYESAARLASALQQKHNVRNRVVICHSESQQDQINIFWACVLADAIPCILPKLAYDEEQRAAYLRHLTTMLISEANPPVPPLVITSDKLSFELECCSELDAMNIESLDRLSSPVKVDKKMSLLGMPASRWDDILSLHLTSGSTGFPKAVAITHGNALSAAAGKSAIHGKTSETRFLNWLSMDHAAGLVEFHIWPMFARANQVHIPSRTVLSDPPVYLRVLSHAQIDHAFAPMFFLKALLRSLKKSTDGSLDVVRLKEGLRIVSGGEAVNTAAGSELVREHLSKFGAQDNVIIPGFGLSETCAGFCFNFTFPQYDLALSRPFASQGLRNPGTDVRIVPFTPPFVPHPSGVPGEIQLRGPNVFKKYWNNPIATAKSFTSSGWFRTGDSGYLTDDPDSGHMGLKGDDGRLLIVLGRDRDSLVLDGKKYALEELLSHIQDAGIEGLDPMWCTVFPIDQENAAKGFVLLYKPTYDPVFERARHLQTVDQIYRICIQWSPLRPHTILAIQEEQFVPKTTLGKLSMFKMRERYMSGKLRAEEQSQASVLREAGVN